MKYTSRYDVLMSFSQTGIAGHNTPQDEMLAEIILRLERIEATQKMIAETMPLPPGHGRVKIVTIGEGGHQPGTGGVMGGGGGGKRCTRSPVSCVLPDGHEGNCRTESGGITGGGKG